jgi:HSP20 family protein
MADITRWQPYDELTRMRDDISRIFAPFFSGGFFPGWQTSWGPSVDVRETDTHIEVSAEIPGVNPGDIDLTVTDDSLTIRGEIKHQADTNQQGFRRIERRYGSFQRTIPFPVAVKHEQATADYRNGILEVKIPKAQTGQTRVTRLKVGEQRQQVQ